MDLIGIAQCGWSPEQHAIDHAEHGRVGPDPEGQRQHDARPEGHSMAEPAHRVSQVLRRGFEPGEPPRVARVVLDAAHASEGGAVAARRFLRRKTRLTKLLRLAVEMKPQLVVQVALQPVTPEEGAQPEAQFAQDAVQHGWLPQRMSSTRPTATVIRPQASVSLVRCVRPDRVSW
jgi:hypothetical protein